MTTRWLGLLVTAIAALAAPAAASAAPPPNDAPDAPGAFAPFTAENGTPSALQAEALLAEATADPGVPRCLGAGSFARTVWLTVSAAAQARTLRLAALPAAGEPDEAPQLAAFVQPPAGTQTTEPQACDGGEGLLDRSAELELRVPAGRGVLVQVGTASLSRAAVSLEAAALDPLSAPPGDTARDARPVRLRRVSTVPLAGATITDEDPAQPACPAGGTVWRSLRATRTGVHRALASGAHLGTLTAFVGTRPRGGNARACANRTTSARLRVRTRVRRGQTLWLRLGTDRPDAGTARLQVTR